MKDSNGSPAVETRDLVKKFGAFTAVDHLHLRIAEGETYGLLGPNGSGKTTTIKILCGLLRATSGEAFVLGSKAGDASVTSRIGYMPQETALYLDLTVHENLRFFGEIFGMGREAIASQEETLLRFVGLQDWRGTLVANLSGGMKHRLSLACSLLHDPELLFLDEPTVGVDPELRASFWDYFTALQRKGVTVVITTHYIEEAHHCSRIGLLREGQLIAEGVPDEIMRSAGTESLEDAFLALARRRRGNES
jgi:ABC-2 type transport system ATP-binding protein